MLRGPRPRAAAFLLGFFASFAQVLLFRELLVACSGNELVVGIILAAWLLAVGAGGVAGRFAAGASAWRPCTVAVSAALAAAACLPFQIAATRALRLAAGVPGGETLPLGTTVVACLALVLPTGLCVGLSFPALCALSAGKREARPAIGGIYSLESAGSVVSGLMMTFLLLPRVGAVRLAVAAPAAALAGAAAAAGRPRAKALCAAASAVLLGLAVAWPRFMRDVDGWVLSLRWSGFGVGGPAFQGTDGWRLVAGRDSRYQNLALVESGGQTTLYANGEVLTSIPDQIGFEHLVHFVMAQKPDARSVLLVGGCIEGEGVELLKYPLRRLVQVELDPAVGEMLDFARKQSGRPVICDARLERMTDDAPRYLARCGDRFDAVIVRAPDPLTASANRFYTAEFFRSVAARLETGGFMYTSVSSSERLERHAARCAGSVYRTLRSVFEDVRVTSGSPTRFFAAGAGSPLSSDPAVLEARSRASGVTTTFFRPEYFFSTDELDPEKTARVMEKLESEGGALNTLDTPVTYLRNLSVWCRSSVPAAGWACDRGVEAVRRLRPELWPAALACLVPAVGAAVGARAGRRVRRGWTRAMSLAIIAASGAAGMALEIVVVHTVQGVFGYVYAWIGLILAAFMTGMWLGARAAASKRVAAQAWLWLAVSVSTLALAPLLVPLALRLLSAGGVPPESAQWVFHGIVLIAGAAVGMQFPLAASVCAPDRNSVAGAAAAAEAADTTGAAAGCIAVGVAAVPALGMTGACALASSIGALAAGAAASAWFTSRRQG